MWRGFPTSSTRAARQSLRRKFCFPPCYRSRGYLFRAGTCLCAHRVESGPQGLRWSSRGPRFLAPRVRPAWAREMGLRAAGEFRVSTSLSPGATSRLPAPPTIRKLRTPGWRSPLTSVVVALIRIAGLAGPRPWALIATSAPWAVALTLFSSNTSPSKTVTFGSAMCDGLRTTAVTGCPRLTNSRRIRLPSIPEAPYSTSFLIHLLEDRRQDQAFSAASASSSSFLTVFQFRPVPDVPSAFWIRSMGSLDFPTPLR
jgi:hypothetical protein